MRLHNKYGPDGGLVPMMPKTKIYLVSMRTISIQTIPYARNRVTVAVTDMASRKKLPEVVIFKRGGQWKTSEKI